MGFWTNKNHRTVLDDAEWLGYPPEGGRVKMWLLGVGLTLVPIGYGIRGLYNGQMTLIGKHGANLELHGAAATAMAISMIAVGVFIHFHWFWGIHQKLSPFSAIGKILSATVFIGSFGYMMWKIAS
jgi:hypothetical protein